MEIGRIVKFICKVEQSLIITGGIFSVSGGD